MAISRTTLASTTTVPDGLAYEGSQAWTHATGTDSSGVGLLKALLYQFQTGLDMDLSVGSDGAGKDVFFYSTTTGSYLQWDQSALKLLTSGKVDLELAASATGSTLNFDASESKFYTAGKVNVELATSGTNYMVKLDPVNDKLYTSGKVDVEFAMSGTSLDKTGTANKFMVDATADEVQLLCRVYPSSVGPTTAVANLPVGRAAFYRTGGGSLGIAYNSAADNIQYGTLTASTLAY